MSRICHWTLLAAVALLVVSPSDATADEQSFYNKSFFLWFQSNNPKLGRYSNRFYISTSGTIFGYSNAKGGCANTGVYTKLNATSTQSYVCTDSGRTLRMTETGQATLVGDTVTFVRTAIGEGWSHTWAYSFSFDGAACKIIYSLFDGKQVLATPISCEVRDGNVAGD